MNKLSIIESRIITKSDVIMAKIPGRPRTLPEFPELPFAFNASPKQLFIICIIVYGIFPLIPFINEFTKNNNISDESLYINTPFYLFSIGVGTKNPLIFIIAIVIDIILLVLYGNIDSNAATSKAIIPIILIIVFFCILIHESYHNTVREKKSCLSFILKSEGK